MLKNNSKNYYMNSQMNSYMKLADRVDREANKYSTCDSMCEL